MRGNLLVVGASRSLAVNSELEVCPFGAGYANTLQKSDFYHDCLILQIFEVKIRLLNVWSQSVKLT